MKRQQSGYSLMELMLVLSILGITACWSVNLFLKNNHPEIKLRQLMSAIQYARALAIRQGEKTTLCGSSDAKNCDGAWHHSLIIKMGEGILQSFDLKMPKDALVWKGSLGKNQSLVFSPMGFTDGQQGSFYFTIKSHVYRILISHSGTIRLKKEGQ